jgi:hypothetical protein
MMGEVSMQLELLRLLVGRRFGRTPRDQRAARPHRPALVRLEHLEARWVPSFLPAVTYPVGTNPDAIAVGDFNGDGKPDLAVVNGGAYPQYQGSVSILLNQGNGTFAPAVSYPVEHSPVAVAVGDFNGDGKLDLAVVNRFSSTVGTPGTVSILLGKGDGTFTPGSTITVGMVAGGVAAGDFRGNGKLDLAVTNFNDKTVSILLGQGDGTFAAPVNYNVGDSPSGVAVGDFNRDGKLDLVVVNSLDNTATILLGKGDGTFDSLTNVPLTNAPVGRNPSEVVVGDFNGDGKPDIAVANGLVSILLGKGDGTFAPAVGYDTANGGNLDSTYAVGSPDSLAVGDLVGNGKQDLVVGNESQFNSTYQGSKVTTLLGNGDGTFGPPIRYAASASTTAFGAPGIQAVAAADFNGDGRLDLVAALTSGNVSVLVAAPPVGVGAFDPATATWYLRNTSSSGTPDAGSFSYGAPGWIPVVGDWNGSGTFTVGVVDPATATWYLRNENSSGAADFATFQYGAPGWIPVVGDWNGSGHSGIGMYDTSTGTWYLRTTASPGAAIPFVYGGQGLLPVVGDWRGNGHAGVGVFDPATASWYLRSETNAGAPDAGSFQYGVAGWTPGTGDWDGNGTTTVGVVDPIAGTWYLRNENSSGVADAGQFGYGLGSWQPMSGLWSIPHAMKAAQGSVPASGQVQPPAEPTGSANAQAEEADPATAGLEDVVRSLAPRRSRTQDDLFSTLV